MGEGNTALATQHPHTPISRTLSPRNGQTGALLTKLSAHRLNFPLVSLLPTVTGVTFVKFITYSKKEILRLKVVE